MIPKKDWITTAKIMSCNRKEILYTLWKNPNCADLKNKYQNYSKLLDKVIKDAKFKFKKIRVEASSRDAK